MKLELIAPTWEDIKTRRIKGRAFQLPPLALTVIASLTPLDIEVHITDENREDVDFDKDVDLVGITAMTATAPRAYQIADEFRKRGVKVVLGGIHVTALPDEAADHADAVVIGEAEGVWAKLISDFRAVRLQKFYKGGRPDLSNLPLPRRDLLDGKGYFVKNTVQTSRGCPFNCDFCTVTNFFGNTFRFRPVQEVADEIRKLKAKFVGFIDDNIVGNIRHAKELFEAITPLKIKWVSQGSLTMAKDPELLRLAYKSGCRGMYIGFESILPSNLKQIGKTFNVVNKFKDMIKRIHDSGISIEGAFIFGLDNDDKSIFERTVKFAKKVKLDSIQFGILTPFPGTRLFERLRKEGRIFDYDWTKYDIAHVVFKPKLMSPEELQEGHHWSYKQFYSVGSILSRTFGLGKRWKYLLPILIVNASYMKWIR